VDDTNRKQEASMNMLKNLTALFFLTCAQANLDRAKRMYEQYEGADFGQQWGDMYMAVHRFWQSLAMALTGEKA
jgi:hypothetical protein